MNQSFPEIFKKTQEKASSKNRLISYSLMWMGLGIAIIFLMTYLVISVSEIRDFVQSISNSSFGWSLLLILNIGLIFSISFFAMKLSLPNLIILYISFILIQGVFLSTTIYYYGFNFEFDSMKNVFLLFLVPSLIFIFMGILGYFQIFDFSKIIPFLIFATIGLMVFSLFLYFFGGVNSEKWYCFLGIVVFTLWIGFDIWWIQRTSEQIQMNGGMEKPEMIKIGLVFGLRLFVDFINLLMFFIRMARFK